MQEETDINVKFDMHSLCRSQVLAKLKVCSEKNAEIPVKIGRRKIARITASRGKRAKIGDSKISESTQMRVHKTLKTLRVKETL